MLAIAVFGTGGAVLQTVVDTPRSECAVAQWPPDRLPLIVTLDPSAREWAPDLDWAAAWWNAQLPGSIIVGGELPLAEASVGIQVGDLPRNQLGQLAGQTISYLHRCRFYRSEITLYGLVPDAERHWTLAHELGHVLGLEHTDVGTLMAPRNEHGPPTLPEATIHDLRQRYPDAARR